MESGLENLTFYSVGKKKFKAIDLNCKIEYFSLSFNPSKLHLPTFV
jgi:hypothetical protein